MTPTLNGFMRWNEFVERVRREPHEGDAFPWWATDSIPGFHRSSQSLDFPFPQSGADHQTVGMDWVSVSNELNPALALLIQSRLEAAGFLVSIRGLDAALATEGYSLATGGVRVQVPQDQADEARAFLEAEPADTEPGSPA
jgi:hypothetical protein